MRLIVITSSEQIDKESDKINALFDAGLDILHIRKPDFSKAAYIGLLEGIEQKYHNRIKIHDFFELADNYDILGVHLNKRNPHCPHRHCGLDPQSIENKKTIEQGDSCFRRNDRGFRLNISKSCHSIRELRNIEKYDYVFLSPIFDSISKNGYRSNFCDKTLTKASLHGLINRKVIALGGINAQTIPLLKKYAFGGAAVLGTIWEAPPERYCEDEVRSNSENKGIKGQARKDISTQEVVNNFLNLKSLL